MIDRLIDRGLWFGHSLAAYLDRTGMPDGAMFVFYVCMVVIVLVGTVASLFSFFKLD